ncbi:MAG TPA: SDR family NAD(P)-dependent oxidoreductase, partial [Chloroflexota bacterium]|nr:SDR family NAD(P)-dependent oxidoreductase [Chloroflexota bacterium]
TGAGSGLGRELALQLDSKGYSVVGTARSDGECRDIRDASGGRVRLSIVDITDEDAVRQWADSVKAEVLSRGLDLLINNAGILTPGPLEVLPLNAIRREFEVNLFGGITVTNALLPSLRQAGGRVLFIGAMTGRFPLPFNGPSSVTKAALEALADVYRAELSPWGIGVTVAQAGNMLTGGPAKTAAALQRTADAMTAEQRALYADAFSTFSDALNSMQSSGLPASDAAARIIELAEQQPAPTRAPVGPDAESILQQVREKTDSELDVLRLEIVGLGGR